MILFPKTLSVTRMNRHFVDGQMVDGTPTVITFKGEIQPLSNADTVALNVGRKDLGKCRVFSDIQLVEGKAGADLTGDLIAFDGGVYEMIQENKHANGLLPHYLYIAELRAGVTL